MSLSRADRARLLDSFRAIVREELAIALSSRRPSNEGNGALDHQGDDQCETEKKKHMDLTDVAENGGLSRARQLARDRLSRLRQKPKPSSTSRSSTTRQKAAL